MATALTVTTAKAGNKIKLVLKSLGNGTFSPVISLAEDYAGDRCLLQEIINMPVPLFIASEVVTYPGFKPAHRRADIGIVATTEVQSVQAAYGNCLLFGELDKENITSLHG